MGYIAELQRKTLETLMGAEAMGTLPADSKFTDANVCRNFLCGMCPHDLFTNTREDLGRCPKLHSAKLKDDYDKAIVAAGAGEMQNGEKDSSGYLLKDLESIRREHERNIIGFVDECNRRINNAHKRLQKTPEENNKTTMLMREIGELQTAYDATMEAVAELGEAGNVEQSMEEAAKADALQAEKKSKETELQRLTDTSGASGHQKLRVCDICGAYLSILDSDRRLADHFGGKMHLGYLQLRDTIEQWRTRGPLNLAAAPESMKPPPVPENNPAYAGLNQVASTNGTASGDSRENTAKRQSDMADSVDGNREREKRRRYD